MSYRPFLQEYPCDHKRCAIATASLDPSSPCFLGKGKLKTDHVSLSHGEMCTMSAEVLATHGFPTR